MNRITFLFVWFLSFFGMVEASELKKYNLSVAAVFKNESRFLKEWIEYHRLAGVDHFYLYNAGSGDRYKEVLGSYLKDGTVTVIEWVEMGNPEDEAKGFLWSLGTQVSAYENAIYYRSIKESEWLVLLDIDEFLLSPKENSLKDVLKRYKSSPGVIVPSDYYDASAESFPRRKLVIQTVERTKAPKKGTRKEVTKTIFKPALCQGFSWPPYECSFKDGKKAVKVDRHEIRINQYLDRNTPGWLTKGNQKKMVMGRPHLTESEMSEMLDSGYEVEDPEKAVQRYVPEVMKNLGLDSIW